MRLLVLGATGLVGSRAVEHALASPRVAEVTTLVRRATGKVHDKLRERVVDWEAPVADLEGHDAVLCALGTTIAKAGSQEAFRRVDHDLPLRVAEAARRAGARAFALVSSVGADARSGNFYLRTKGELEDALRHLDFPSLHLLRPSLLVGDRTEERTGERLAMATSALWSSVLFGPLRRYRAIDADVVARALVGAAVLGEPGVHVHEHDALVALARAL